MPRPNPASVKKRLETSQEFQQPRSVAFGQASERIGFLCRSVFVIQNGFFQCTDAAIVKQWFVVGQLRSQPPESPGADFSPGLNRHPFTQNCGPSADVM